MVPPKLSVPTRTALVAAFAMALAMAVAWVMLVTTLRSSLTDEIDRSLSNRAADVSSEIDLPNEFLSLANDLDPSSVVAVVARDGFLFDATDGSIDGAAVVDLGQQYGFGEPFTVELPLANTAGADNLRVVLSEGQYTAPDDADTQGFFEEDALILVGSSLDGVDTTLRQVATGAAIGGPVLVVLTAFLTFFLTRRALRPVDVMQREVNEITASDLAQRVADPGTDDEIGRLAHTMNAMLARLQSSQRAQRQFVADASHELRSPLASMTARIDVARRHGDTPESSPPDRGLLAELRHDTERMEHLVQDLLLLARSDADGPSFAGHRRLVDLDDVVFGIVAAVGPRYPAVFIDTTGVSAGLVVGDQRQLERVVRNLIDNAARHAASAVRVTVGENGADVMLVVDDDGSGVAPEERRVIFERFVRLDDARSRDAGGSGLGLAIVAEILRAHDGAVTVATAPGGGARFTVELPAAPT